MTPTRTLLAALLLAAVVPLSGCGLPAELDREADPARTATPSGAARTDEAAPSPSGPACPASGTRVAGSDFNAAMGLRSMTVTLTNCGPGRQVLAGYPALSVLDEEGSPTGTRVERRPRTTAEGDAAPVPAEVTLRPGESASFGLMWRNTAELGKETVEGAGLEITPGPQAATVHLRPEIPLDLGSTGRVEVSPWSVATGG